MTWYLLVDTVNTDGNIFSYRKFIAISCDPGTQKSRDEISQKRYLQGHCFEYFFYVSCTIFFQEYIYQLNTQYSH